MDIVARLRSHWGGERIADVSIDVADAADMIEQLRRDVECARECSKVAYADAEIRDRRIGRLQDALDRIANIDYRGNAHESLYIAREALKEKE